MIRMYGIQETCVMRRMSWWTDIVTKEVGHVREV
jgi:hypothetical protein